MRPLPALAGLLALPTLALATSLVPHTLLQRAEESDRVALVQVLSQRVEETPGGGEIPFKTLTRVAIGQDLRGSGPSEVTIVQLGGKLGLQTMEIPGDAQFHIGETAIVFIRCRLAVDRCHLVAMGQGKLDVAGNDAFVQDLFTGKWARRTIASLVTELAPRAPVAVPAPSTTVPAVKR
jgi:hypothetical protein